MFVLHFSENKAHIPTATANRIRREAVARYKERVSSGYANGVLDFSDLIEQVEKDIQPR